MFLTNKASESFCCCLIILMYGCELYSNLCSLQRKTHFKQHSSAGHPNQKHLLNLILSSQPFVRMLSIPVFIHSLSVWSSPPCSIYDFLFLFLCLPSGFLWFTSILVSPQWLRLLVSLVFSIQSPHTATCFTVSHIKTRTMALSVILAAKSCCYQGTILSAGKPAHFVAC